VDVVLDGARRAFVRLRWIGIAIAGVAVVVATLPLLATAQLDSRRDPRDTKGILDVRRVEVSGIDNPRFATITFSGWRVKRIWDRGYFLMNIDARGDRRFEKYAFVYSDGSRVRAFLYRNRPNRRDRVLGSLSAWKANRRKVVVKVPLDMLLIPEGRIHYRWFVKSLFTGRNCRRVCIDRVPNKGAIRTEFAPAPSPTPTETPSPSPTPTPTS
jgi:hypothetical protein